jgi:2-oxoisovalerate dehydrogenase E2 component (dihydrolipoyl transacylase)
LSLTYDHRFVTGGEAARFMKAIIQDLEQPQ